MIDTLRAQLKQLEALLASALDAHARSTRRVELLERELQRTWRRELAKGPAVKEHSAEFSTAFAAWAGA